MKAGFHEHLLDNLFGDGRVSVTISSGATMLEAGDTAEKAVGRADKLMYKSKESGRDRVTVED